jgi:sensor histidine kinase YesM
MRRSAGTVGEEAELTRAYLGLFSMRMGQRLKFTIQIDPCMMHIPMPTMMLLTLVENAIKHGLMPSEHGGTVSVVARREQGVPVVAVIDDGVGFGVANTSGTGIGLSNIKARLAAMYGHEAKLVIESVETGGVRAAICLPKGAGDERIDQAMQLEPLAVKL